MNQNDDTTPVLSPILNLLRSRAFWVMVFTAALDAVIAAVPPDFAPVLTTNRDTLINVVTGLALAVIGKIGLENAVQIHADGKVDAANAIASATIALAQAAPAKSSVSSTSSPENAMPTVSNQSVWPTDTPLTPSGTLTTTSAGKGYVTVQMPPPTIPR